MKGSVLLAGSALAWSTFGALANTWDEPWQDVVVAQATSVGLFQVDRVDGITAHAVLVKPLAGEPTGSAVDIDGYSGLSVTSASSDHWDLWLKPGERYYLYLTRGPGHTWRLPTPSSGADRVQQDGRVQATYRISMHKALIPVPLYEMTQRCIFQSVHGIRCDRAPVEAFIREQLTGEPASLGTAPSDGQLRRFFLQHAALETAAAVHYEPPGVDLPGFLGSPTMHVQFSALKLMAASQGKDVPARLGAYVCSDRNDSSSRGYALHLIASAGLRDAGPVLKACLETLPGNDMAFALTDIMDPRIGTRFPYDLHASVDHLLGDWNMK